MYVCLCNALRDREIDHAIAQGGVSCEDVYRTLGVEPQCGACACDIEQRIAERAVAQVA